MLFGDARTFSAWTQRPLDLAPTTDSLSRPRAPSRINFADLVRTTCSIEASNP